MNLRFRQRFISFRLKPPKIHRGVIEILPLKINIIFKIYFINCQKFDNFVIAFFGKMLYNI